jgi:nucleotide-binding universal stress UspA family protein
MTAHAGSSGGAADEGPQLVAKAAALTLEKLPAGAHKAAASMTRMPVNKLVHAKAADADDALERESGKGYDIIFIGVEHPIAATGNQFEDRLQRLAETFEGPLAIVLNGSGSATKPGVPLKILVPTGGTPVAGLAIEIALAIAKGSHGALTVLHVFDPEDDTALLRGRPRRQGLSLLVEARRLGKRSDVTVKAISVTHAKPEAAIQRAARAGRYHLVVVGTSLRQGETKFLGPRSSALLRELRSPVLLVAQ